MSEKAFLLLVILAGAVLATYAELTPGPQLAASVFGGALVGAGVVHLILWWRK